MVVKNFQYKILLTIAIVLLLAVLVASFSPIAYNPVKMGTATLNFPSTNPNESSDLTLTVTGATDGDVITLGVPNAAISTGSLYLTWVSSANTVTIRFINISVLPIDPPSSVFRAATLKF